MQFNSKKIWQLGIVLIAVLVLATVTGWIVASYLTRTEALDNTFTHADSVTPTIYEDFDQQNLKKDVYFGVGETDYPVYVRAKIVFNWQRVNELDENGHDIVYMAAPVMGRDYTMELNENDWILESDGFYYYPEIVYSNDSTPNLVEQILQLSTAQPPEGYRLNVEILVQTVQAVGSTDDEAEIPAYQDAWGVDFSKDP